MADEATKHLAMSFLSSNRVERVSGFGMSSGADGYVFRPTSVDEIRKVFDHARSAKRQIVLRGAGRSYGDASEASEAIVLDLTRMNRVLNYDAGTGLIDVEAGATIADIWKLGIVDGWWPPVVSGTMFPTISGAIAMNIHGKNHFRVGSIAEHVNELDFLTTDGKLFTLKPADELFQWVTGSAGQLGVITRAKLQLKRVRSGNLRVLPISIRSWKHQFEVLDEFESKADYLVSWVDCFARGGHAGRGLIHAGWYIEEDSGLPTSLKLENQELPDTIMSFVPKSMMWRFLKPFNNRFGMRMVNAAKYRASKMLGNEKPVQQSLAEFSFLLDYVPNWRNAYLPDGFIQYQCFVPKENAQRVFSELVHLQQSEKCESFLAVLKRHRADSFPLSYALDGFSLALDFKVKSRQWNRLEKLCHRMNEIVLDAGGKFYFAKDSTLRPEDVARYLGSDILEEFRKKKSALDPDGLLTSALAQRLKLF